MNIKTILKGTKEIKKIYIRLYQSKIDVIAFSGLSCLVSDYNPKKDCFLEENLNISISELRAFILKRYNLDYSQGKIISNEWLKSVISDCFNRPLGVENTSDSKKLIYISEFAKNWITEHSSKWKTSARKYMSESLRNQYKKTIEQIVNFEKKRKEKILFEKIDSDLLYEFVEHFEDLGYNASTIEKQITRFKFFCFRAVEMNIRVNTGFKSRIYIDKDNESDGVYLNESEIKRIYDLDLSHDNDLDNIRDLLVIASYTGLRVSDLMTSLKFENIKNEFIEIRTKKTNSYVKIPLHKYVREILNKRFGQLPSKTSSSTYNRKIKLVCRLAEIDNQIYGFKMNPETRRKEFAYYPKFELITSHTGRRSFVSNHIGKIDIETLKAIGGWKSEKLIQNCYNQTTKTEYAQNLKNHWDGK
jgi:site-specific recombinase XerD